MSGNPFRKLYKKLRKMSKRHGFILRRLYNVPREDGGGEIRIIIEW